MDRIILNRMNDCWSHVMRTVRMVLSVQSITRDLECTFPAPATGRFPDLQIFYTEHLPGLPVVLRLLLTKYGDEFVQDSHLFPFSPVQIFHVVPLIIHNQDAIIHLTDTSRICIKLYVTTGSFYHTYTNASRNVINWRIWPHFRL